MKHCWVVTCEHASHAIPKSFRSLFSKDSSLLKTHCGYDFGARHYAEAFSKELSGFLACGQWTRLLVDLNRSLHNPNLFSQITKNLNEDDRQKIVDRYYFPFRENVFQYIHKNVGAGKRVIHISCHTFTPAFDGLERKIDLGILYDPSRTLEKALSHEIRRRLLRETAMRVRCNAPYKGISDGHVTALRKVFPKDLYIGIELEVSQALYMQRKKELWQHVWLPRLIEVVRSLPVGEE